MKCKVHKMFDITLSTKSVFLSSNLERLHPAAPPPPLLQGAPVLQLNILQKTEVKVLLFVRIRNTNHIHIM